MSQALFTLLRAGLWGDQVDDLTCFPLSTNGWKELFDEARKQTVTGIVYHGITLLPENQMPPIPILSKWVAEADRVERYNHRMNNALDALLSILERHGIIPIVLKGQGIAALYETPEWRECGDIDLYIPQKDTARAVEILRNEGICTERHADGSICYTFQGVEVEHHASMIDIAVPAKKRYIDSILQEDKRHTIKTGALQMSTPPHTTNLLMLNAHIMKHAIGRGIGLRQLCDLARAYHIYNKEIDYVKLAELYRNAGIERWSMLLHAFLIRHLGLPQGEQPYEDLSNEDTTPLLEIILRGGNFGQHHSAKQDTSWRQKWQTAIAFWDNRNFAWKYARKETIWTIINLSKGQMNR